MTNAELIAAIRICANQNCCDNCPRYDIDYTQDAQRCCIQLINDAADALEAAEKRIHTYQSDVADLEQREKELNDVLNERAQLITELQARIAELEAQLPKEGECEAKKPKTVKETEYSFYCDCPTCRGRLISNVDGEWCGGSFDRFCRMCGQKIDWSEYCGWSNKPYCGARMKGEKE